MNKTIIARFWEKVDKTGDCWEWTAYKNRQGYGVFGLGRKSVLAHRVAWTLVEGDIPHGVCVLHTCDNPQCVSPEHLFLGSNQDNMDDKVQKGRQSRLRGSKNGRATLTERDVLEIRSLYPRMYQYQLAGLFGVSQPTICKVVNRNSWAHI